MPMLLMIECGDLISTSIVHYFSPRQFELAKTNIEFFIIIAERTKLDELSLLDISERVFGCLIKTFRNIFQVIDEFRAQEETCGCIILQLWWHSMPLDITHD